MFDKITTFQILKDGIEVIDGNMAKVASEIILPEGHTYDPDFLYMKVRAVSAGEYWGSNKNADFFPEEELKKHYKTFLNAHAFKNHENKDVANAIGDVVDAVWNDRMKYVELLIRIDRKVAPTIVRGFEKGFMTDVSMGCRIAHSVCSICGNIAKTKAQYCDHIKFEKHRIYPDGRRVYEINIGPKFHDISTVLNGADKTAKVTGLMIAGSKVAFYGFDESLEKTASDFTDTLYDPAANNFLPFFMTDSYHSLEKVSLDFDFIDDSLDSMLSKTASNKADEIQKIAEIKKMIQGKVTGLANAQLYKDSADSIEDVLRLIKIFYTDYWTEDKCREIAESIKDIASKRGISVEDAFEHFLHTAELAGIELSSLEFDRILRYLSGCQSNTENIVSKLTETMPMSNATSLLNEHDDLVERFKDDCQAPKVFKVVRIVNNSPPESIESKLPIGAIAKALFMKTHNPDITNVPLIDNDMMDILSPHLAARSYHEPHLIPRMIRIVTTDKTPNMENLSHFMLPLLLKSKQAHHLPLAASALGYSAYQNNRVKLALSEDHALGLEKFASTIFGEESLSSALAEFGDFTKEAAPRRLSKVRYGLTSLPVVYGYSAMQRSRLQNGENISSFNRYMAENPTNAWLVQSLLVPGAYNKSGEMTAAAKKALQNLSSRPDGSNILKGLSKFIKKADDGDYLSLMEKQADIIYPSDAFDMFNNKDIDAKLREDYNDDQITALKYATVFYGMDKESAYNDILDKYALSDSDVNKYLKISTDSFRIEIEKNAKMDWDMAANVASRALTSPAEVSLLSLTPGFALDNIVLNQVFKKIQKDIEKRYSNQE